ncbi:MAG: hypothetical protein M1834_008451 [Cirrosporium novae-zelandiae]|nr:MAG: hypothetical protein M1834_008451 [Cirrosporium novae-zelandiae]
MLLYHLSTILATATTAFAYYYSTTTEYSQTTVYYTAGYLETPSLLGGSDISCKSIGYTHWYCSAGQYCVIDSYSGDAACCPDGWSCYEGSSNNVVTTTTTVTQGGAVYATAVVITVQVTGPVCPTRTITAIGDGLPTTRGCVAIVSPASTTDSDSGVLGRKEFGMREGDIVKMVLVMWTVLLAIGGGGLLLI